MKRLYDLVAWAWPRLVIGGYIAFMVCATLFCILGISGVIHLSQPAGPLPDRLSPSDVDFASNR